MSRLIVACVLVLVSLVLAGCGDNSITPAATGKSSPPSPPAAPPAAPPQHPAVDAGSTDANPAAPGSAPDAESGTSGQSNQMASMPWRGSLRHAAAARRWCPAVPAWRSRPGMMPADPAWRSALGRWPSGSPACRAAARLMPAARACPGSGPGMGSGPAMAAAVRHVGQRPGGQRRPWAVMPGGRSRRPGMAHGPGMPRHAGAGMSGSGRRAWSPHGRSPGMSAAAAGPGCPGGPGMSAAARHVGHAGHRVSERRGMPSGIGMPGTRVPGHAGAAARHAGQRHAGR